MSSPPMPRLTGRSTHSSRKQIALWQKNDCFWSKPDVTFHVLTGLFLKEWDYFNFCFGPRNVKNITKTSWGELCTSGAHVRACDFASQPAFNRGHFTPDLTWVLVPLCAGVCLCKPCLFQPLCSRDPVSRGSKRLRDRRVVEAFVTTESICCLSICD